MRRNLWPIPYILLLAVAAVGLAGAQTVPQLINYQGKITDSAGQPLADGSTVDLTFAFYGVESGATPLYLTVLQEDVVITGGIYSLLIGSGTVTPGTEPSLAAVFQKHGEVWMGMKVDAEAEMAPRARIATVPYSMSVDPTYIGDLIYKADWDGDGFLKSGNSVDCNDGNAAIHPGAPEICDGLDNQCPGESGYGLVDEGCFCADQDNDGYFFYNPQETICGSSVDCNDGDTTVHPGATDDTRDGIDQDCNGSDGRPLYMFSSVTYHYANMGGRTGIDAICQTDVSSYPGLPTANVRGFITAGADDEIIHMPQNYGVPTDVPVLGPTGKRIGDNWADILDTDGIQMTLQQADIVANGWWSGSYLGGSYEWFGRLCNGWTSEDPLDEGNTGCWQMSDQTWLICGIINSCRPIPTNWAYVLCISWDN